MPNMTLAIPEDLHALMKKQSDINWSEVARKAIKERAETLALLDKLLEKSKMTEKDALELGHSINRAACKRMMHDYHSRYEHPDGSAHQKQHDTRDNPQK